MGEPDPDDQSIVALLLRIRCKDGCPLPELRFWSELSIFFFAGDHHKTPSWDFSTALIPCRLVQVLNVIYRLPDAAWGICRDAPGGNDL